MGASWTLFWETENWVLHVVVYCNSRASREELHMIEAAINLEIVRDEIVGNAANTVRFVKSNHQRLSPSASTTSKMQFLCG